MWRFRGGIALVVLLALTGGCSTASKVRNLANGTSAKRIAKFSQRLETAQKLVYTADYESKDSGGKSEKVHVVQKPPKSAFTSGDTTIINDGQDTFTCGPQDSGKGVQCIKTTGTGGNGSLAGFTQGLSGAAVVGALSAAAIVPGFDAKESTRDVAGQHLDCVSVKAGKDEKSPEYCVTADGILGFVSDEKGNVFTLTSFQKSASDSEFTPPGKVVTPEELANQSTSTTTSSSTTSTTEATTSTTEETTSTTTLDTSDTSDTTDTTAP
jgi:hypothetical protein